MTEVKKTRKPRVTKAEKEAKEAEALAAKEAQEAADAAEAAEIARAAAEEEAKRLAEEEASKKEILTNKRNGPLCLFGTILQTGEDMELTAKMKSNDHGMKSLSRAIKMGFVSKG
jgi:flagellar biosynthesis GTPase FlhF